MKTNEEFLSSMWKQITLDELDERQKRLAKAESKRIIKNNLLAYMALLIISLTAVVINFIVEKAEIELALSCAALLLILAYLFESCNKNNLEGKTHEYRNRH